MTAVLPTYPSFPSASLPEAASALALAHANSLAHGGSPTTPPISARARRHWKDGRAHASQGRWQPAAAAHARAAQADPGDALHWFNLANAQRHLQQFEAAIESAQRGLQLTPFDHLGLHLVGECLAKLHRYEQAVAGFAALEAAGSEDTSAMLQHAGMLAALNRPGLAAEVLLRALMLKPHLVRGHALLGEAMRSMGKRLEAVECMKTVLALEPDNLEARSHLSYEKRHVADWSDLQDDIDALERTLAPAGKSDRSLRPVVSASFGLLSLPLSPCAHLAAARGDALVMAQGVQALPPLRPADLPAQRIRIGLVSFDFREHPVSQLLVEVLEKIDRSRFELFLYSSGADDGTPLRRRVEATADSFVELRGLSDQQVAERVRADAVLLLIDLAGHTRGHRMGVFARRPAPVQVSYLGYPGSTGADCIDYLIGDPLVTPLQDAAHFSEKIAQLPGCLLPNGRWRPLPQPMTRQQAGLPEGAFVLCAFNHTYKILPPAFDIWCSVLREVPHAVLWLKETNRQLHHNLRQHALARGVDASRLLFAPVVAYEQHFSRLALADVFVDTWPYNAHTTACDALWAGLPVLTLQGQTYASRVAASALQAVGLGELAFSRVEDYALALRALALDPELLLPYRQHLQQQRLQLPLFDSAGRARELQDLFMRMLQRWHAGLPAQHLPARHPPAQDLPAQDLAARSAAALPQQGAV